MEVETPAPLTKSLRCGKLRGCRESDYELFDNRIGIMDVRGELVEPVPVQGTGESSD